MPTDIDQQIATLKARRGKIDQKLNSLEQKAKNEARKRDTRRKIVVGGAVLAHMEKDAAFAVTLRTLLAASVGRAQDRETIRDLLASAPAIATPHTSTPDAAALPDGAA